MIEFLCFYHVVLFSLLNDLGNRLRSEVENFISPVFLHLFTHVEIFKSLFGDRLSQMFLKVLVVDNAADSLSIRVVGSTSLSKPKVRVFRDVFWHQRFIVSQLLSSSCSHNILVFLPFAHLVKVCQVGFIKVLLHPTLFSVGLLILSVLICVVKSIQLSSLLLAKLTEVTKRNVSLLVSIEVFKHGVNLVHLELDSEMIESFLKLIKTNSVVEVDIEVSVSLSHSLEPLIDFDP